MSETASAPAGTNTPPPPSTTTAAPSSGAPSGGQTPATIQASPPSEMFEVKVNGRTVKMSRQEVLDHASMSHAANDKFNEAKKLRQEYEKTQARVKTDFMEYITDPSLGLTKEQIRDRIEKWYNKEFIEPEGLTPEQRRVKSIEEENRRFKEEKEEEMKRLAKQAEDNETNQQREYFQQQIIEALEKSNLPKTKDTVQKMAFFMRQNLINGWDAPLDMVIRQVKDERLSSIRHEVQNSTAEQLIETFGEELVNKIRTHDLQKLRERRQLPPVSQSNGRSNGTGPLSGERMYSSDVNKRLRDIRLGKI